MRFSSAANRSALFRIYIVTRRRAPRPMQSCIVGPLDRCIIVIIEIHRVAGYIAVRGGGPGDGGMDFRAWIPNMRKSRITLSSQGLAIQ